MLENMILEKQNGRQSAIFNLNPNLSEWNESRKKLNFGSAIVYNSYWVMLENMILEKQNGHQLAIFDLNPMWLNEMKVERKLNNFSLTSDYPIYNS